jgi:hypothetical protein
VRRRRGRCDRHCGVRTRGAQATVALEHERSRPSSFIIGIEEAQSIIAVCLNPTAIGHCASNKTHRSVSNLTPKHLVSNSDQAPAGGGARAWRRQCTSLAVAARRSSPTPNRPINHDYRTIRRTTGRLCGLIESCLLIKMLRPIRTINHD